MSFLFGGGKAKSPAMPAVPPPAAIPVTGPDTEDYAMKMAKRKAGFSKTILAGSLEPTSTGKRKLLG